MTRPTIEDMRSRVDSGAEDAQFFHEALAEVFDRYHGIEPSEMGRITGRVIHEYVNDALDITMMLDFYEGMKEARNATSN